MIALAVVVRYELGQCAATHPGAGGAVGLLDEEGWRPLAGGLD